MTRAPRTKHAALELRPATGDDVAEIHAIECASFGDPWRPQSFRAAIAQPPIVLTVARRAGALVGYLVAWHVGDEAELTNLAVAPAVRRGGVGAALLDDFLRTVAERGGATVYLEVRDSNGAAQALYRSRGFAPSGRRPGYYRAPEEDAVVMKRPGPERSRPD